jgi:hypothetical protein
MYLLDCFNEEIDSGYQMTYLTEGALSLFSMERLFGAAISTRWRRDQGAHSHSGSSNLLLAEEFDLWWTPQKLPQAGLEQESALLIRSVSPCLY